MGDWPASVAIIHPRVGFGGSELPLMWTAETLKAEFRVSIISGNVLDLDEMNRFCGTRLQAREVTLRQLRIPMIASMGSAAALRGALSKRALRSIIEEYDVVISAYNPCDLGKPAIHFLADFSWDEELRRSFDPPPGGVHGLFHRLPWLRASYLGWCRAIAPPSGRNLFAGEDLIVANSEWTAARLREKYGAEATVLHPPVAGDFPHVAFEQRSDDFVCVGRISPEKRVERMIRIVAAIRSRGHGVRIRIIGPLDDSPYSRMIGSVARQNPEWVLLEGRRMGKDKARIVAQCRYGIHARAAEPFGIAVAEMVKGGCITFAPAEGGQAEIVDHPALLYGSEDEAVDKIIAVLESDSLHDDLRRHLRRQGEQFSAEKFMSGLRDTVDRFLRQSPKHPTKPQEAIRC